MSGYGQNALAYHDLGWTALPLPHARKTPPPAGTTGSLAPAGVTSYSDIVEWVEMFPDGNLALRLPLNVVGLDVDAYKPNGLHTMQALSGAHGLLPPTWRSSSKLDGVSGIYLYRVDPIRSGQLRDPRPQDVNLPAGTVGSDVEMIRWNHRYVIAAPSTHDKTGDIYQWWGPDGQACAAPSVSQLPELPAAWVEALTATTTVAVSTAKVDLSTASGYELRIVTENVARLTAMKDGATSGDRVYSGEPWDITTFNVAARLTEVANADWSRLSHDDVESILVQHAPRDSGFDESRIRAKLTSARNKVGASAAAAPTGGTRVDDSGLFKGVPDSAPVAARMPNGSIVIQDRSLDVTNTNVVVSWLRDNLGTGRLSGVFFRKGDIVYTPRIGEEGYIEMRDTVAEGGAAISVLTDQRLRARVQHRFDIYRTTIDEKATKKAAKEAELLGTVGATVYKNVPDIFPLEAAKIAVAAPDDMPSLRELHGVVHTPSFRADGSMITIPGYDDSSGLLFLPTGGQPVPIPDSPRTNDIAIAKSWIDYMLADFKFVNVNDRANYIGLLLTPLMRAITPAPFKLGVIEAHQPGSGKTFLARALCSIHGGLMHAEMPTEEVELSKTIATVLDAQTAPVVVFDNVTGIVRSPTLAGLLTSPTFQARRLGGNTIIEAENDRLWMITGNNAILGGDLQRRNIRVRIDPGVPSPENRTEFAIRNFEDWVREHRGELLWSLLVLVRAWVVAGRPLPADLRQDSYGRWSGSIAGILHVAGIPGIFDASSESDQLKDPETEEWETFLETVWSKMGDRPWTTKTLLTLVAHPSGQFIDPTRPIPYDALPSGLSEKRGVQEPSMLGRSLGRWLLNREGRWAGSLTVRNVGIDGADRAKRWKLERYQR